MANIKVSEMTEATSFDDGDYTMIVQANQNKKISKENILGDIEGDISTISDDISTINTNISDLSNTLTEHLTPTTLYEDTEGTTSNITLSDDISNYSYYEIIYSRNGSGYSSLRLPTTYITNVNFINSIYLSNILRFYSANITISGTTLTRNYDTYINFTGTNAFNFGTSPSISIHKVIGYK